MPQCGWSARRATGWRRRGVAGFITAASLRARQIGEIANKARIIFLTQESAPEVVQEAFNLGAWGYITKAQAGTELLPAVEVVSRGERFTNENSNNNVD